MKNRVLHTSRLGVAAAAIFMFGCGEKTKPVNAPVRNTEDGKVEGATDTTPTTPVDLIGKDASFLDATYDIAVTSLFGISVCKGDINLKFNAAMGEGNTAEMFEIPKGDIDCGLAGKINLAEVLGAFGKQEQVKDPVVVKNNLINLKQLGGGTYHPPRPLLPSFIATKKEALAALNYTETTTLTSLKDGKKASGTVNVRTIGVDQSYKPVRMQRQFNKVLHFEVINKGFQDTDKFSNMLFDRMEFKISLDPIAVVYIEFKGKISDALKAAKENPGAAGGAGGAGAAGGIGGLADGPLIGALTKVIDVTIKLDLVKMKGLKDINSMAEEGDDDLGEEIGGKKKSED